VCSLLTARAGCAHPYSPMETVDVMLGGVREQSPEDIALRISSLTPAEVEAFWARAGSRKRQQYEDYVRRHPNARFSGPNMTADAHVEDLHAELKHIGTVDWKSMRKPVNSLEDAKERARIANDSVEKARLRHQKSLLALKQARMLERKAHQEAVPVFEEESLAMEAKRDEHMARVLALQHKAEEAQRKAAEAKQKAAEAAANATPEYIEAELKRREAEKLRLAEEAATRQAAEEEAQRRAEEKVKKAEEEKKQRLRRMGTVHMKKRQEEKRLTAKADALAKKALEEALDEMMPSKESGGKWVPRVPYLRAGESTKKLHELGLHDGRKIEEHNWTRAQAAERRRREKEAHDAALHEAAVAEAEAALAAEQEAANGRAQDATDKAGGGAATEADKPGAAASRSAAPEHWLFGGWFASSESDTTDDPAKTKAGAASTHGGGRHIEIKSDSNGRVQTQVVFTAREKEERTHRSRAQEEEKKRQERERKAKAAAERKAREEYEAEVARQAEAEAARQAAEAERQAAETERQEAIAGCIRAVDEAERCSPATALLLLNDAKREMERLGLLDAPELAAVNSAIPTYSPAFVLDGQNDGFNTEALGGYVVREGRYTGRVRTYYLHTSGRFYMYTHADHLHATRYPSMWLISTTLAHPHGVWAGAVNNVEDGPDLVETWATHKHGTEGVWLPQLDVRTREPGRLEGGVEEAAGWTSLFEWMTGGESQAARGQEDAARHRGATTLALPPSDGSTPPPPPSDGRERPLSHQRSPSQDVSASIHLNQQAKTKESSLWSALSARRRQEGSQEPAKLEGEGQGEGQLECKDADGPRDIFAWFGIGGAVTACADDDAALCADKSDAEPVDSHPKSNQALVDGRQPDLFSGAAALCEGVSRPDPVKTTPKPKRTLMGARQFLSDTPDSMLESETEDDDLTNHSMPTRVPAFVFRGPNDGHYTDVLGGYHMATSTKGRGRTPHYVHDSGSYFMYRYKPPKGAKKQGDKPPNLWVVSHTLDDPNGYWIGTVDRADDPPTEVTMWVTHVPGDTNWIRQPHVRVRDDEVTLYEYVHGSPVPKGYQEEADRLREERDLAERINVRQAQEADQAARQRQAELQAKAELEEDKKRRKAAARANAARVGKLHERSMKDLKKAGRRR